MRSQTPAKSKPAQFISSPIPYVGAKSQAFEKIVPNYFPKEIGTYHEIFFGGGSIGLNIALHCNIQNLVFNEFNSVVYRYWKAVRNQLNNLTEEYDRIVGYNGENIFDWMVDSFNKHQLNHFHGLDESVLFQYVAKYSFKATIKFLQDGTIKPSFGNCKSDPITDELITKSNRVLNIDGLNNAHAILNKPTTTLTNLDFRKAFKAVKAGDFVYCDPPYAARRQSEVVKYTPTPFTRDDQLALVECAERAVRLGTTVLISNIDNDITREYYKNADRIEPLESSSRMSGRKGKPRTPFSELLAIYRPYGKCQLDGFDFNQLMARWVAMDLIRNVL